MRVPYDTHSYASGLTPSSSIGKNIHPPKAP
jgi:hypothetical protein